MKTKNMKTKKLFKKICKKVNKSGFIKQDYKLSDYAIEIETYFFTNLYYEVYIHRYYNSVRFFIQNRISKEEAIFEVWSDKFKYTVSKDFYNKFFDKVFKMSIKFYEKNKK